ncbi:tubulin folding cofactor D C terminal-domain-containing protein [Aspergillus coremiiformis]|uniref:Tubulin folding cofactor D C terminal-domain-containing protein n=1 Tax=Aspergillus coremiiformis TaxID=138285 RepID=A0A5N6Z1N3_9EURO|nr:tubulin folding cofactor D C terminal-domain-containing protein [Aspergillus coremiiformis]
MLTDSPAVQIVDICLKHLQRSRPKSAMDAAEDKEVKLQRASGDLVKEFSEKLPSLLWKPRTGKGDTRVPRRWTQAAKTERLVGLLEPFQEWPQLLDPHLQTLLPPLVDAFLAYLLKHRDQYKAGKPQQQQALYPLPRAICRLLYTFCKVRGVKVISRFLNNEPKYLDPLLRAFIDWDAEFQENSEVASLEEIPRRLVWEERYVTLIWLSHLLLAPFDLAFMSSNDIPVPYDNLGQLKPLLAEVPMVARSLLSLSLNYVNAPGKEREAATVVLARLVLRRDMRDLGLLTNVTDWAFSIVQPTGNIALPSVYTCIGVLSFLARLGASGQVEDFAPLIVPVFEKTLQTVQGDSEISHIIQTSALARKMIIKILRTMTIMALQLSERAHSPLSGDKVSSILEDTIDHLLVALADKDTPVRFAASKALSIITLKLDPDMGTEVIEAVTGSLEENILYEKSDGTIVTSFEARRIGLNNTKRNLSAVDAQRWQGLILTLGHLLFRRAPPTNQLLNVLQPLVSGLDFEQRSSTGSSVGTGVRDASCFGIWALSRKYTTQELLVLNAQTISSTSTSLKESSILQMLATELVCAACVDPSGNIRRGASAALQELIGRHPDTVAEGIALVQVVDYHAVARRSRAMIDVAKAAAALSDQYWSPLVESLMHWRGIGSPDAESRRQAAKAIGALCTQESYKTIKIVLQRVLEKLSSVPRGDIETRHGCFLTLSATVDAFNSHQEAPLENRDPSEAAEVNREIQELWDIFNSPIGPTKEDLTLQVRRPELSAEASSCLIYSLSRSTSLAKASQAFLPSDAQLDKACETLLLCVSRSEGLVIETSSNAISELFPLLPSRKQEETINGWFSYIHSTWKLPTGRGQISVLGAIFKQVGSGDDIRQSIILELLQCAGKEELIEKRVVAVKSLATGVLPHIDVTDSIADQLVEFLNDYTTDRRGDIGSLVRLEAIQAVKIMLQKELCLATCPSRVKTIIGCLCRLAAEKLDKVRLQAWLCLQSFWESAEDFPPLQRKYEHFSHVSLPDYFLQLLELQAIDWLRLPLFQGVATSAVAGAEGLVRSSRSALVQSINKYEVEQRPNIVTSIVKDLMVALSDNLQDDRYAIPILEFLAFLLDGYISSIPHSSESSYKKLFVLVQRAHFKSSNIGRLEAAIKVYAPLSRLGPLRAEVLKKMTAMLLHPFPRVRNAVAEYFFMETALDSVKAEDWAKQPKELKDQVENVRNLEERVKVDQLKEALEEIFSEYGTIIEIVAKTNMKAKGQAFIVFDSVESASNAIDEINGFELFDKPMVLDFAKTRSDATVLREGGDDELEIHKRRRLAEKERKQAHEALEAQKMLKRPPGAADSTRPAKAAKGAGLKPTGGATAAVIPDEYLPPNKILFLRDLPDSADQESLTAVFGRFEGFQEVRLVPGRKGIAFVEYENESGAISAKEATSGIPMGDNGKAIRVTYQRQ